MTKHYFFQPKKSIGIWLLTTAIMVFAMAVIGAITRLTESGLSIVDWRPITGIFPPMSPEAWAAELEKYRNTPEYQQINKGMSIADFQTIYWWEYIHRLWGRLIGLVYGLPLIYFWVKGELSPWLKPHLIVLLILGGLQGYIGWWMVQSGLVDRVDVSQYRLATHLTLAFFIFAYLLTLSFKLLMSAPPFGNSVRFQPILYLILILVFATMIMGAFVAGMNAGLAYNTWPLMDGEVVPQGLWSMTPVWINLFENPLTVQFLHRWIAQVTVVLILLASIWILMSKPNKGLKVATIHMIVMAILQLMLGIKVLLLGVPIWLGAAHQAGAFLLLACVLWALRKTATVRTGI